MSLTLLANKQAGRSVSWAHSATLDVESSAPALAATQSLLCVRVCIDAVACGVNIRHDAVILQPTRLFHRGFPAHTASSTGLVQHMLRAEVNIAATGCC